MNAFEDHDQVSVAWSALKNPCEVKGICGLNSYCTLYDRQPNCVCIPGTEYADPDRRSLDCLRNYAEIECGSDGKENVRIYNITRIESIKWGDISYAYIKITDLEECSRSCLEDCNCGAGMFDESSFCIKQKLPLRNVRRDFDNPTMAFFEVGKRRSTKLARNKTIYFVPAEPSKILATDKKVDTHTCFSFGLRHVHVGFENWFLKISKSIVWIKSHI